MTPTNREKQEVTRTIDMVHDESALVLSPDGWMLYLSEQHDQFANTAAVLFARLMDDTPESDQWLRDLLAWGAERDIGADNLADHLNGSLAHVSQGFERPKPADQ